MTRRPPKSPLFPYTTLFRSGPSGSAVDMRGVSFSVTLFDPLDNIVGDRKSTRLNSNHSYISYSLFFFFNDTAPPEISPLSLHDALPIWPLRLSCGYERGEFLGHPIRSVGQHRRGAQFHPGAVGEADADTGEKGRGCRHRT